MLTLSTNLYKHRELIAALAKKNIIIRYKQSLLGLGWAIVRPTMLLLIFALLRSLIGFQTGPIPYTVLAFSALTIWLFFQDAAGESVTSIVANSNLIKKIYFPREIFPVAAVIAKLVDFAIAFLLLLCLMAWYGLSPGINSLWIPLIVLYAALAALAIGFVGSAINVYLRDVSNAIPILLNLVMYATPVMYPLSMVQNKLQNTGDTTDKWSGLYYQIYLTNPMAGIVNSFQSVLLRNEAPELETMLPGLIATAILLPISYIAFKHAESHFADVI